MIDTSNNQCILLVTNKIISHTIKLYQNIAKATVSIADVFILYHTNSNVIPPGLEGANIKTFTDEILYQSGYKPVAETLVPGSNHFPVLHFFLHHPKKYKYYWCIEDDVVFSGNWTHFFKNITAGPDYDFISSHIRRYADMTNWLWWNSFRFPEGEFSKDELISSFNPVYRLSNSALKYLDICLQGEYSGHHEVLIPSLLRKAHFKIADLSTKENHLTPLLKYCTLTTMRWKPVVLFVGIMDNKLYHPVKVNITFRQFLAYVKRTLLNRKKYLDDLKYQ